MKTAISVPDDLFERGEQVAKQLGLSRSQLYSRALREFLRRHDPEFITAAFNAVYSTESSELDPVLWDAQLQTLLELEWQD
jgi:metal-responsive CopG/Arc/MetJ family transcriptional regulator